MFRVALISAHTCPLAELGSRDTGGMNVYIRETSRAMGLSGIHVDIFTRAQRPSVPMEVELGPGVKVVHLQAGPVKACDKYRILPHLPEFLQGIRRYASTRDLNYDLIHTHYWISGLVGLKLIREWKVPLIHMYHTLGILKNMVARNPHEMERTLRLNAELRIARGANWIVSPSPLERAQLVWYYQVDPFKITVIPCGVDPSLFRPMEREEALCRVGLPEGRWLLFVGRIEPIKGLDTLFDAVHLFLDSYPSSSKDLRLIIVGGRANDNGHDPNLAALRERAHRLRIEERVHILGSVRQELLPYYYSLADVCIMPSRYESFGLVALEAQACGTPVIATKVGGLNFTVLHGKTGFLVPEGNPKALAQCIHTLIMDQELKRRMGRNAREWAKNFQWGRIAGALRSMYKKVLEEGDLWTQTGMG